MSRPVHSASLANAAGLPRVALVGRPNVGKSSLFNRLLGQREAIVLDRPGVTRDRIERVCRLDQRVVVLQDTGGIVPNTEDELLREVTRQALAAAEQADVLVLLIDGRQGVTLLDEAAAAALGPARAPTLVAVNKLDAVAQAPEAADAWRLGFGAPWPVSAEQGLGVEQLVDAIEALLPPPRAREPEAGWIAERPDPAVELHVAVVGRPNVGKSSLVNRLAGAERVTVSATPGTTRDAVDVLLTRNGRRFRLVDTAGLRRRGRTTSADEAVGIVLARRRLVRCHVAVLVLDAVMGPTTQDVAIGGEIYAAGRPQILALNKWDLVDDAKRRIRDLEDDLDRRFAFVGAAPRITVSARTGQRAFKILDECGAVAAAASHRVSTAELNRFLATAIDERDPGAGLNPRALYITQTGVLPPRFVVFCREPRRANEAFRRWFERRLRSAFPFGATPIVLEFRPRRRR